MNTTQKKNQALWENLRTFTYQPLIEIAHGLRSNRLPLAACLLWASGVGLLALTHWDTKLWTRLHLGKLYPQKPHFYYTYCLILLCSGFWTWGIFQSLLRNKLIRRLTQVFIESGLKSPLGRLPGFILDRPIDEFTRRLKLGRSGFSKQQFEKAKLALESGLQIYIDEIRENREQGSIDLIYSHTSMPALVKIDRIHSVEPLSFVIGKTRARQITASLENVPHLMVAGQTGGGKSTFLRSLITTLYLNNPDFEFTLIDLKGGLEFQLFERRERIKVIPSVKQAVTQLQFLEGILAERMELLKSNNCKDITAYLALPESKRKSLRQNQTLNRHILVVDEAAEMFLAGPHAETKEIQNARRVLSQIARQGRGVGVHLVIATQRPDAKALDPQVKANLTGVLCFQMLNDASSITVLGTGRATELPPIPGRAIWKQGSETLEIQTPFLGAEEAEQLLRSKPEV